MPEDNGQVTEQDLDFGEFYENEPAESEPSFSDFADQIVRINPDTVVAQTKRKREKLYVDIQACDAKGKTAGPWVKVVLNPKIAKQLAVVTRKTGTNNILRAKVIPLKRGVRLGSAK